MPQNKTGRRLCRFALFGILAGLLLLACVFVPVVLSRHASTAKHAIKQESLLPARGEAFAKYGSANVTVHVLANGKPTDSMSVSPDGQRWYTPQNGLLALILVPGEYHFQGLYENRIIAAELTVRAGEDNLLVLDAGKAPQAPELITQDYSSRETQLLPLEINGADMVYINGAADHLRIVRQNDGFALEINASQLPYGFYPVALHAENDFGKSITHVGIRLPREGDITPIYTVEDLDRVRQNLSGSYRLMNALDMGEVHDWVPIGTEEYPFTGVFDGGGFEITGFHSPDSIAENSGFAIFDGTRHAEIRNIILRAPEITPKNAAPSSRCAGLISLSYQTLVENCAVIGGIVAPSAGSAAGVLANVGGGIATGLFNSADVFCPAPNKELKNTGGVCGNFNGGYGVHLANEGEVFGTHLTAGVAGFQVNANISRCVNSGYIWGSTIVGEFPVGAIAQTVNDSTLSDSYFLAGLAPVGGNAFTNGSIRSLLPVGLEDLRTHAALPLLGSFGGESPAWTYASLDARGPVPFGIFKRQAETPVPVRADDTLILPPVDGLIYFYTLDGSDPRTNCPQGASKAELKLSGENILTVFTARQGCRDSEMVTITAEGGAQ